MLCSCPQPTRDLAHPDRLRCDECEGWTAHGRPLSADKAARLLNDAESLVGQLRKDLPYAEQSAYGLSNVAGDAHRGGGHSDPTLAAAAGRRALVASWGTLATRMAERALVWLRLADEAAGNALLAAETNRGPDDHTKAAYHDTGGLHYPDPSPQAAQARRRERGEL